MSLFYPFGDDRNKFNLYFSLSPLRLKKATTVTIAIVGIAITIQRAIEKRSHESMCKTDTKGEAKRLRTTTFALAKLKEQ